VRKNGGRVISFSHGGLIGLYDTPTFAFSEFALSDEFITYTPVSIALFDKIKANHSPLKNNQFIINSIDTQVYFKLWRKHKNKALPLKIKKVMLLGFPLNQIRNYTMAGGFSLMRLDLELRIIESLEKSGYRVIYKVHPDRRQEAKGLFQGFNNVEIWEGYFEDCLDQVDAFIFSHLRTTAFSSALCTNKPIISLRLEPEFFKPLPEAQELLAKRCDFINAQFDERNRIIFNEKEFLACLAKRPEFPNNDFLKKYMFPSTYSYYG
jgi:hypothetical protein